MILDCQNLSSALSSVSDIIGIDSSDLVTFTSRFHRSSYDTLSFEDALFCQTAANFDIEIDPAWIQTFYFHGTRTAHPPSFLDGLLPIGDRLEAIWAELNSIARLPDDEWQAFRHHLESVCSCQWSWLYRHKTGGLEAQGPFGFLVRDALLMPRPAGLHDYLGGPEIIEDILRCFDEIHQSNSLAAYVERTSPCIIKFQVPDRKLSTLTYALLYIYEVLNESPESSLQWTTDAQGKVAPKHIANIEVLNANRTTVVETLYPTGCGAT